MSNQQNAGMICGAGGCEAQAIVKGLCRKHYAEMRGAAAKERRENYTTGRPSLYDPAYCEDVVEFCRQGYSLTAFAGRIDVGRETITRWCEEHEEFRLSAARAKAGRASWWEDRARRVALEGGPGGQATMIIFGLKNHASEDFSDKQQIEHTGKDGGPIATTIEDKRAAAKALLDEAFGEKPE